MTTVGEHKKALNQAEKIEQEFITLMTGQKQGKEKPEQQEERQMVATLTPYTQPHSQPGDETGGWE